MPGADRFFSPVVKVVAELRTDVALELDRSNQLTLVDHHHIPKLGRSKVSGQRKQLTLLVNVGMGQPVRLDDVDDEFDKPVHVVAADCAGAPALVVCPSVALLRDRTFASAPEALHGFAGLALVRSEIECNAYSLAPETMAHSTPSSPYKACAA